jgi:nicotinate-nucleotide--dimethylbenzimidazole phosphoribosyltransferase
MSVTAEVRRTLVKSPPELWAELSDPATLARHLGELGEIRIVATEPDRAVDWEAAADGAQANGRVEIEPSGWGTRVTLSAHRAILAPDGGGSAPDRESVAESPAEPPIASAVELAVEPQPVVEADPAPEPPIEETESRQGFFARIFRRRRSRSEREPASPVEAESYVGPEAAAEAPSAAEPEAAADPPAATEPEQSAAVEEHVPGATSEAAVAEPDISTELVALEEQTTAVLTGVLDRLGAAHHRPFSRA